MTPAQTLAERIARLNAFCNAYADACPDPDKAMLVRMLTVPLVGLQR